MKGIVLYWSLRDALKELSDMVVKIGVKASLQASKIGEIFSLQLEREAGEEVSSR